MHGPLDPPAAQESYREEYEKRKHQSGSVLFVLGSISQMPIEQGLGSGAGGRGGMTTGAQFVEFL